MKTSRVPNRTSQIFIRMRPHERDLVERAALADRERFSVWARSIVVDAAKRRLAREEQ